MLVNRKSKRRILDFLFFIVLIVLVISLSLTRQKLVLSVQAAASTRSNILVFLLDDLDEPTFSQLLNNGKLPNIKKYILDKGVRFINSFVTDSICCASRATFLTGKYPHNTGVYNVWGSEGGLRSFTGLNNNIATWLQSAGYQTAHIGKFMGTAQYGPGGKPGWNYWRNITSYDSRPGMYPVYDNQSQQFFPDLYQAKYISDTGINFLSSTSGNFFMVLAPHTPHVLIPSWGLETDGAFSPVIESLSLPLVGYNEFDHPDPDVSLRKSVTKGPDQNGNYHIYGNDYRLSTASWGGWQEISADNAPYSGTGSLPIVAFSAFIFPDQANTIRQHLIRGNQTSGYDIYYRDIVNNVAGLWILNGTVATLIPNTGNLPVAGFGITSLPNNMILQYLLRGDTNNGFELYSRARVNGTWSVWMKEPEGWDSNSGSGDIVEINVNYVGNASIELQFVRKDTVQQKYIAYYQVRRSFYADLPPSVLGVSTLGTTPDNTHITTFEDEGDMFNSPLNTTLTGVIPAPNIYWSGRVFADGNWANLKASQTFPLSLYGGKYPAGTLRSGGDPNGFAPIDSRFDPPHINSTDFNSVDCATKVSIICQTWPDLNQQVVGGKTQIDYLKRFQLDRLESMISLDVMVGQVIDNLQVKGLLDNTAVIFTSDNGHFLGEYRLGNKVYPYEDSIHVPLVIRPPNSTFTSGAVNKNTVVNLDLAPTMLDYAGLVWDASTYNVDGRSLRPLITSGVDFISSWRKWFLTEFHFPRAADKITPDWTVINNPSWYFATAIPDLNSLRIVGEAQDFEGKNSLYVNYYDDPLVTGEPPFYEYYDMVKDPNQTTNLYNNSTSTIDPFYKDKMTAAAKIISLYKSCSGAVCRTIDTSSMITPTPTLTVTPTPTPINCRDGNLGNLNCDSGGLVNETDLSILLTKWAPVGPVPTPGTNQYTADLNGDGKVDEIDLARLLNNWKTQ